MTVALSLPLLGLSDGESELLGRMRSKLSRVLRANLRMEGYYEGTQPIKNLRISIPPTLENIGTVCEWPATVVDMYAERMNWVAWGSPGDLMGLDDVAAGNLLPFEFSQAFLDMLIHGVSFLEVSKGGVGEPDVLVNAVSPLNATGEWDSRLRRLTVGYVRHRDGSATRETLYTPNSTVVVERFGGIVTVIHRDEHRMGRVPLVRVANRMRGSRVEGRSEITRAIRYYTDAAVRTLTGMEVNREFYTSPQRYAEGAEPEMFGVDEDSSYAERKRAGWNAAMTQFLVAPQNEDGTTPNLGSFPQAGPTPYWESIRALSQMCASAAALPSTYFGFVTDNPDSGDAIRQHENRLVKRTGDKLHLGGWASREVARLSILTRGDDVDEDAFSKVYTKWGKVATPTEAADADRVTKLVGSQILPAESKVTWDLLDLSPEQQTQLEADLRRSGVGTLVQALRASASQAAQDPEVDELASRAAPVDPDQVKKAADAMGVLIRSGVDPADAAARTGMTGLKFTGAVPVQLRMPETDANKLEDK